MKEFLEKKYKLIAFDWDGTAVYDRNSDCHQLACVIAKFLEKGTKIAIITGTNINNINNQFLSLLESDFKQNIYMLTNRGSEVFAYDKNDTLTNIYSKIASQTENDILDKIAIKIKQQIEITSKTNIKIIFNRMNRRKINLNSEWENPPKEMIKQLVIDTNHYLDKHGWSGRIKKVCDMVNTLAKSYQFKNLKITTDGKFVEIGITDKKDSMKWLVENIEVDENEIIVFGDEFGKIDGINGSDYNMILKGFSEITYVSVGVEPFAIPKGIIHEKGGEKKFLEILNRLLANLNN
ncbi:MAG: HAD hydrolase family protein [Candidatus Gastranaerophilales bacterium]|nr:HAD hydrolase family protein [Candidatus Gastranaerophilales bacterium]